MSVVEELGVAGALSRRGYADLSGALSVLTDTAPTEDLTAAARVFAALVADDLDAARRLAKDPDVRLTGRRGPLALFTDVVDDDIADFGAVAQARSALPDLSAASGRLAATPLVAAFFTRAHATGVPADREALHRAVSTFEALGIARPADACRAMLREAGVPLPRRPSTMDGVPAELRAVGVTSRELEVLRLIADGRSNREIAATLYLSPRTVEKHVERLLMKTGAANRTALAGLLHATADGSAG
jgi:DNA-binding CsgD family transcriptional regulator